MDKARRNTSGLLEAVAPVKLQSRSVLGADREFQLADSVLARINHCGIQQCAGAPFSPFAAAYVDHDQRCAMRHFAGALSDQAQNANRLVILESYENRSIDQSLAPLLV